MLVEIFNSIFIKNLNILSSYLNVSVYRWLKFIQCKLKSMPMFKINKKIREKEKEKSDVEIC